MDSQNGIEKLKILTVEEVLTAQDIEEKIVPVPQWGGAVVIRGLTQKQSAGLRRQAQRQNPVTKQLEMDNEVLEQLLFIEGVVQPKFSITDYGKLQDKSMAAMTLVLKAVMEISGFGGDAVAEATKSPLERTDDALRVYAGEDAGDDEGGTDRPHER